jgi:hypothetical protein
MSDEKETSPAPADLDPAPRSHPDPGDQSDTPSRRELIERYGKYAIVGAPLLLFVSKARAIHSKP